MSESAQSCIRGCTIRGRHLADCVDPDQCRGCIPRLVPYQSRICVACLAATRRALVSFEEAGVWLRENVERGTRGDSREVNEVARAWAPLSIEALSDLDDLANLVATWVMVAIEEHPGNLHGPDWHGARVVPASKRNTLHAGIVYDGPRVVGVRAGDNGTAITAAARWMESFADWYAAQPWADQWVEELTHAARGVRAKWPECVKASKAPLPCPKCNQVMLWFHPPVDEGGEATVICHGETCDCRLTVEDYWIRVHEKRRMLGAA